MKSIIIFLLLLLCIGTSSATTYYIDYDDGSDSNNGLTKGSAWKTHPYMQGAGPSYSHIAGDRFIFKIGPAWPYTMWPMEITDGGDSVSNKDYYGTDRTWYSGTTSQPKFDAGGSPHEVGQVIVCQADYVTIDDIDFDHYFWTGDHYGLSYIDIGTQDYVNVNNSYFHGWSHGTHAGGTTQCFTTLTGNTQSDQNTGVFAYNCTIDGIEHGGETSGGVAAAIPAFYNCTARNLHQGYLVSGNPSIVDNCTIESQYSSFDYHDGDGSHPNAIEQIATIGDLYINNTILKDSIGVCIMFGNPGRNLYMRNVLIDDSDDNPVPIQLDIRDNNHPYGAYIYGCTINVSSGSAISQDAAGDWDTLVARNNHIIGVAFYTADQFTSVTADHNIVQTYSAAVAEGYTKANGFRPTSASGSTVDAGTTVSSLTRDLLGVVRPQGGVYDAGAYEFEGDLPEASNSRQSLATSRQSVLSNTSFTLRPVADGHKLFVPSIGTDHYALIDEAVEDRNDYLTSDASEADSFTMGGAVGTGPINAVTMYASVLGDGSKLASLWIGTSTISGYWDFNPAASPTLYSHTWSINPTTGLSWTWDDIASLEPHLEAVSGITWYQMYIVVSSDEGSRSLLTQDRSAASGRVAV